MHGSCRKIAGCILLFTDNARITRTMHIVVRAEKLKNDIARYVAENI